jgi:hypothetical protein
MTKILEKRKVEDEKNNKGYAQNAYSGAIGAGTGAV